MGQRTSQDGFAAEEMHVELSLQRYSSNTDLYHWLLPSVTEVIHLTNVLQVSWSFFTSGSTAF